MKKCLLSLCILILFSKVSFAWIIGIRHLEERDIHKEFPVKKTYKDIKELMQDRFYSYNLRMKIMQELYVGKKVVWRGYVDKYDDPFWIVRIKEEKLTRVEKMHYERYTYNVVVNDNVELKPVNEQVYFSGYICEESGPFMLYLGDIKLATEKEYLEYLKK